MACYVVFCWSLMSCEHIACSIIHVHYLKQLRESRSKVKFTHSNQRSLQNIYCLLCSVGTMACLYAKTWALEPTIDCLTKEPTSTFDPISCIGSVFSNAQRKFAWLMECTCGVLRSTAWCYPHLRSKKTSYYTLLNTRWLCIGGMR